MPTSLLTAAARLIAAGVDVEIHDENINTQYNFEHIGINLLGAPYIPEAIRIQNEISRKENAKYILGGQVISGLSQEELRRLLEILHITEMMTQPWRLCLSRHQKLNFCKKHFFDSGI